MSSCVSKRVRAERPIHCATDLRTALCKQGFGLVRGPELRIAPAMLSALDQLEQECEHLPPDPYCAEANRYRRLSRISALPWVQYLVPRPDSPYRQDRKLNPEHGGMDRKFAPLTRHMLSNRFLHERGERIGPRGSLGLSDHFIGLVALLYRRSSLRKRYHRNGPPCRFIPTCTEYATRAVRKYGLPRGLLLFAWRLRRCHWDYRGDYVDFP